MSRANILDVVTVHQGDEIEDEGGSLNSAEEAVLESAREALRDNSMTEVNEILKAWSASMDFDAEEELER